MQIRVCSKERNQGNEWSSFFFSVPLLSRAIEIATFFHQGHSLYFQFVLLSIRYSLSFSPTPFQNQLCLFPLRRFEINLSFENQSISTHRRINIQTRRPTLFVTTSRRLRATRAENLYRAIHLPNVDALPPRFPQIVHVSAYIIPLPSNGNLVSFPRNSSTRSDFQWIGHLARLIGIQKSNTIFKKR